MKGNRNQTQKQLFTLQTQIRAQLNILRTTYYQISTQYQPKTRKHCFQKLYSPTLQNKSSGKPERSHQKKHCRTPHGYSQKYFQRKHFPNHVKTGQILQFKAQRKNGIYRNDKSPLSKTQNIRNILTYSPQKPLNQTWRGGKKTSIANHMFDKEFFR